MFRRFVIFFYILFVGVGCLKSQNKTRLLNVSLLPSFALEKYDSLASTIISVGLIHAKEANVDGVSLNLLTSENTHRLHGLSINGVACSNDEEVHGLIFSGFGNLNKSVSKGLLVSGYFNLNLKTSEGLQFSGLSNFNIGKMCGLQFCGISNFVADTLIGGQIAAGFNVCAEEVKGSQIGGLMNVTMGHVSGIQLSLANYAKSVSGLQIGLVNAAGSTDNGLQIGLFNYTNEHSRAKIGLINVCKETKLQLLTYADGNTMYNSAARFKTNHLYSILGLSLPSLLSPNKFMGIVRYRQGLMYDIKKIAIGGDIGYSHYFGSTRKVYADTPSNIYAIALRLSFEIKLFPKLSLFCAKGYERQYLLNKFQHYKNQPITEVGLILF